MDLNITPTKSLPRKGVNIRLYVYDSSENGHKQLIFAKRESETVVKAAMVRSPHWNLIIRTSEPSNREITDHETSRMYLQGVVERIIWLYIYLDA